MAEHTYKTELTWTGNRGEGTKSYQSYNREYLVRVKGKPEIKGSADPAFYGDAGKYNPEELFLVSISSCHMLWYLHLCAVNGIVVTDYHDEAEGVMEENTDGSGKFISATLHPVVKILRAENWKKAISLHQEANNKCFIANSCSFPIYHKAEVIQ